MLYMYTGKYMPLLYSHPFIAPPLATLLYSHPFGAPTIFSSLSRPCYILIPLAPLLYSHPFSPHY